MSDKAGKVGKIGKVGGGGGGNVGAKKFSMPPTPPQSQLAHGGAESTAIDQLLRSLTYNPREKIRPLEDSQQLADESVDLAGSLRKFIPAAWGIIEPSRFIPNWHIDAIAEHLEAVTHGDIRDLLITMPPRHSKSLIVAVLWPVWEWLESPSNRWIFASYAFSLSVRDSVKRRNILQSKFWADRWADRFNLIKEQNTKVRFENDSHGFMLASSVGGSNTGEGGERIIADDPHNIKKIESEDVRQDTVNWWNIVMSTRRNDEFLSARVVVQQRTHEGDVAGDIIDRGGYVHLNLPAEFEPNKRCFTSWTDKSTGIEHKWQDPRQKEGDLLNPSRFNQDTLEKTKLDLGDYQWAAQYQQDPTPPKGSIIQAQWLRYYGGPTGIPIPDWQKSTNAFMPMLSLDCTFKEHKDTDFVAGLGWAMFGSDIYLMPICIHERLSFTGTIEALARFVGGKSLDGTQSWPGVYPFIKIKLVEDKANGTAIIDTMRHQISGMIAFEPGNANKVSRLMAGSWRFRAGNIYLPHESICPWIKEYIYELCAFPKARRDDFVDATSQMLIWIGGDAPMEGVPVGSSHESNWIGIGNVGDIEGIGDGSSVWNISGSTPSGSIWRR